MAWYKVEQHLSKHRKTLALARRMGINRWHAAGLLGDLWSWAIDHAKDGYVVPDRHVESLSKYLGTRSDLTRNLLLSAKEVGWIDATDRLHEWDEWGGKIVVEREKDAQRKSLIREHIRGEHSLYNGLCPRCVRGTSGGQGTPARTPRPVDFQRTPTPSDEASSGGRPGVDKTRVDTPYPHGAAADGATTAERAAEVVSDASEPWRTVLEQLHDRAAAEGTLQSFVTHFGDTQYEEREGTHVLRVRNELARDWIAHRYASEIHEVLEGELVIEVRS